MYITFAEDGATKCVWVQPKLESIVRTHIFKKQATTENL